MRSKRFGGKICNRKNIPIRITSSGAYHLKKLATNFEYVDAILLDTIILDNDVFEKLDNGEVGISESLKRVEAFLNYLNSCWLDFVESTSDQEKYFLFENFSTQLAENIEIVKRKWEKKKI